MSLIDFQKRPFNLKVNAWKILNNVKNMEVWGVPPKNKLILGSKNAFYHFILISWYFFSQMELNIWQLETCELQTHNSQTRNSNLYLWKAIHCFKLKMYILILLGHLQLCASCIKYHVQHFLLIYCKFHMI